MYAQIKIPNRSENFLDRADIKMKSNCNQGIQLLGLNEKNEEIRNIFNQQQDLEVLEGQLRNDVLEYFHERLTEGKRRLNTKYEEALSAEWFDLHNSMANMADKILDERAIIPSREVLDLMLRYESIERYLA